MNNKSLTILLLLLLLGICPTTAQRRKAVRKRVVKVAVPVENPRFTEMLNSTQKVIFIDSMIVSQDVLLTAINTNPEEGKIATYDQFFKTKGQPNAFVYVNELGNKCIFSMSDNGVMKLYSSDLLGNEWSTPEPLRGLDAEGLTDMNYPYMLPDGQTLFFAARKGDALGGLDIYRTRFDNENNHFLTPENIGLPFNSEADDFLYVICEHDSIGFFATNRRQPQGQVCVYIFIPTESRHVYDASSIDNATLKSYARINRIRDTWGNNKARTSALRRLAQLRSSNTQAKTNASRQNKEDLCFFIDDNTVYHHLTDFKDPDNPSRMSELQNMQRELSEVELALQQARDKYVKVSKKQQEQLRDHIIKNEQKQLSLKRQIRDLQKEIRNREITN